MTMIEQNLDYQFRDQSLLKTALTHSSYINEHHMKKEECNERLEFLGDSILEMISSRYLFKEFPKFMEGTLSKLRAALVCERSLAKSARIIGIPQEILLGRGMEMEGGRENDSILADAFEAVLAALYLDGGFEKAKYMVEHYIMNDLSELAVQLQDHKTALQEMMQESNRIVSYRAISQEGPEHQKIFTEECLIDQIPYEQGKGHSRKEAQQQAAYLTLQKLNEK